MTKFTEASSNGRSFEVLPVCQLVQDMKSKKVALTRPRHANVEEHLIAIDRSRHANVEEQLVDNFRPRHANVEEHFQPQAEEFLLGGYIYDFNLISPNRIEITVWRVEEQAIYIEKTHFKNTDFTRGLEHLKRILRRDISSSLTFIVLYRGVLLPQPRRSAILQCEHDIYDELNEWEEWSWRTDHWINDGKRTNWKEVQRRKWKQRCKKRNFIPHADEVPRVPRPYLWESRRIAIHSEYENYLEYRRTNNMRVSDCRRMFDLIEVVLSRLSISFDTRTLSTLPGPPLLEDKICEIVLLDLDRGQTFYSIFGWHLPRGGYNLEAIRYFSYWYHHYSLYLTMDQVRSLAFPNPAFEMDPHALEDEVVSLMLDVDVPEIADFDFEEMAKSLNITVPSTDWLFHVENIVLLCVQLVQAPSYSSFVASFLSYMKLYLPKKNAISLLRDLIARSGGSDFSPHAETQEVADWWTLFRTNKMYSRIAYLITAAMSLSICSMKEIKWSIGCFDLLALEVPKHQLSAVDLIDTVVKTYTWIAEVGWRIFTTGDLKCLLFEDQRLREFTDISDYVLAYLESAATGNLEDLNDYNLKLDKALRLASEMKKAVQPGPTMVWLSNKYIQLVAAKDRLIAKERTTAIRFAPIGFSLSGGTSVGKSTLAKLTMKTSLFAMGFDSSSDRIITHDNADKYQSTYTSDINGMFIDDFANLKSKFQEIAPTEVLIKFFNNVAAQAIKAEIGAKGNVFINFKCGVLTTNVQDLDVRQYSNCPESILRRFYHVEVRIRPEFVIPDTGMLNPHHPALQTGELTIDVWNLTIHVVKVKDLSCSVAFGGGYSNSSYKFEVLTLPHYKGKEIYMCENLSLSDYLDVVVFLSEQHKRAQDSVVKRSLTFDNTAMCEICKKPLVLCKGLCWCSKCDKTVAQCEHAWCAFETHGLAVPTIVKKALWGYFTTTLRKRFPSLAYWYDLFTFRTLRNIATSQLEAYIDKVVDDTTSECFIKYTPAFIFDKPWCQRILDKMSFQRVNFGLLYLTQWFPWIATAGTVCASKRSLYSGALFAVGSYCGYTVMSMLCVRQNVAIRNAYLHKRDALSSYAQSMRDKVIPGAAVVATTVILLRTWNSLRKKQVRSNLQPNSLYDYKSIDAKPGWFELLSQPFASKVKAPNISKTTTLSALAKTLERNLFFACFKFDDRNIRCNVFFPRKGVMLFPEHLFFRESSRKNGVQKLANITITRKPHCVASKFDVVVHYDQCIVFTDLDLVMAYVPNCPDIRSCYKWLPSDKPSGTMFAQMMARDRDCVLEYEDVVLECGAFSHTFKSNLQGGVYNTTLAKNGACMGLLLADSKTPCILGMHIGGHTHEGVGMMQSLTFKEYSEALEMLKKKPGVLLSSEAVMIPHSQYALPLLTTTSVHPKAKFFQTLDEEAYLDVLGSTKLRSEAKTQVIESILTHAISEHTGVSNQWSGPQLKPNWRAYNASLDHIVHPALMHSPVALERARQDWLKPLIEIIPEVATDMHIRKLTLKESILGVPGVRFLDALKMDTSMGFPIFGPKINYFREVRKGETLVDRIPDKCIIDEMDRLERAWRSGERAYPVASATLKDEPTLKTKDKVRVFEAVAVAFGLHIRMYFLPIARFLSLFPILSECAVGVNSYSPEWNELMTHVETYNDEKLLAWDYSKYDLRMNSQMTRAVLLSYIDLARAAGYSEEDLYVMEQMVNDIVHPLMDYNGTLIMVYNMNTSGNNITVNINSTANSLYVRMGFFHCCPGREDFRKCCALMTYGDDGVASVLPECEAFNIQSFIEYMALHKMKVTLPTKDDSLKRFLLKHEVDFLKRKSNYIPEIDCRIGALDEMSIFKSLHCNLRSAHETPKQVAVSVLEGAMHEWFAHGREVYDKRLSQMKRVCDDVQLGTQHMFVSFDRRVQMWIQKYRNDGENGESPGFSSDGYSQDAVCLEEKFSQPSFVEENIASSNLFYRLELPEFTMKQTSVESAQNCHESLQELEQSLGVDAPLFVPHADEDQTEQQYTEQPAPEMQKVHNVMFEDARPGYIEIKDGTMDALREAPLIQDASIQDFFSRPLKIASYRWGVGSSFFEDFDPWSLYFTNARVINRISNFKLMHAKLHVKIIINGTPFHYGRLIASYTPLPLTDQLTRNVALIPVDVVAASQRPHVYINPTSSIGGELLLPFFLPQNVLDITYDDWRLMGEMNIRSLQNLKHANGAVDTVTVSVFAWAEDVKMAIPTQFDPGSMVPQADEYTDRPVSKIASATIAMMKPLMMIPAIAPFARATEIGAMALAAVAKVYGYCKTPLIEFGVMNTTATKYQWAPVDTNDYVNKLTVDSKQEITVDPRTTGLDSTDEMSLLNVAKRESYIYTFPWAIGALEESLLFNIVVDPCVYRSYQNGTNKEYHMPACCYAAFPFTYWRGTMRYRFQVVCSNFHRGRLKIVYDPTSVTNASEYNVAYTTIVDISDKTDFTIDVGWGQPYTFKQHVDLTSFDTVAIMNTTPLTYTNNIPFGNGVLSVYVVNELTVPDTTINNDISINVFVSACDDFEVAAPDTRDMRRIRIRPPPAAEALFDPQGDEERVALQDSIPTDPELLNTMGKSISTYDATDKVHFGERIQSFRQMAKRYDWFESVRASTTDDTNYPFMQFALRRNSFPFFPGWYQDPVPSVTSPVDGGNYAYSNFTWLHYIVMAYGGWRGATRFMTNTLTYVQGFTEVTAGRTSSGAPALAFQGFTAAAAATMRPTYTAFADQYQHIGQGAAVSINGSLNFEVPYYNINRFTPARNYTQYVQDDAFLDKYVLYAQGALATNPTVRMATFHVGGAEDFSVYFFLGAPVLYFESERPS